MRKVSEVYNCVFLLNVVRQNDTNVKSFRMQFEKIGHGVLQKAFRGEGECVFSRKRGGGNKKGSVLEIAVNTEAILINKNKCSLASCV